MKIETVGAEKYAELTRLWELSVRATHDFLAEEHLQEIKDAMPEGYLPKVHIYVVREDADPAIMAFAGVSGRFLDMLFVHPSYRGRGYGSALLGYVCDNLGVIRLDVNEQNEDALRFYIARGFKVVGRDELDGGGRPYPLLHLSK